MNAEQRGELLTRVMAGNTSEPSGVRKKSPPGTAGPSRASECLEGITMLTVAAVKLPSRLKNALRWPPRRYADLEEVLRNTDTVRLVKSVWRTDTRIAIRKDTVAQLVAAGVLVSTDVP